jgi:hypothetical protein
MRVCPVANYTISDSERDAHGVPLRGLYGVFAELSAERAAYAERAYTLSQSEYHARVNYRGKSAECGEKL